MASGIMEAGHDAGLETGYERELVGTNVMELLRRFGADSGRLIEVFARSRGMRASEVAALQAIRLAELREQPLTPGDLSHALLLTSGAVTGLVDRLVRAGLARREPDEADRRRVRLRTDEGGRAIATSLLDIMGSRDGGVLSGLGVEELRAIERFLTELTAATTSYLEGPDHPGIGSRRVPVRGGSVDPYPADDHDARR